MHTYCTVYACQSYGLLESGEVEVVVQVLLVHLAEQTSRQRERIAIIRTQYIQYTLYSIQSSSPVRLESEEPVHLQREYTLRLSYCVYIYCIWTHRLYMEYIYSVCMGYPARLVAHRLIVFLFLVAVFFR